MSTRLNALQVATLLVSASYGIGFLFGSGEMALTHGMGGSLYGLATAAGMLLLAALAPRLWRTGLPIWELFGRSYGRWLAHAVALLSVVWMAGVLAAQIAGGVVIMRMFGLPEAMAYTVVLAAIFVASRLDLRAASRVLSVFLLASGLVLVVVLVSGDGLPVYASSAQRFVVDVSGLRPASFVAIVVAVVALVCTGADYHQFVLAATRPHTALWGCLWAGLILLLVSPLPAAVVIALREAGSLDALVDARQVIPFALSQATARMGAGLDSVLLLGLSAAALGSGAAILRAMTGALASVTEARAGATSGRLTLVALAVGGLLAARGQSIVQTMVSVNLVYIGSVGMMFGALMFDHRLSPERALLSVGMGFGASLGVYLAAWVGQWGDSGELLPLLAGLAASAAAWVLPLPPRPLSLQPLAR